MWFVKSAACIVINPSFSTIDSNTDHLFARTMQDPSYNLSVLPLYPTPLLANMSTKTLNCRRFQKYTKDCISRLLLYIISRPCFLESFLSSGVTIVRIWCDLVWCFMGFQEKLDWFENCETVTLTKFYKCIALIDETFMNNLERFVHIL